MRGNLGMFGELFWFPRQCGWKDRAEWLGWGWGGKDLGMSLSHGLSFSLAGPQRWEASNVDGNICRLYR